MLKAPDFTKSNDNKYFSEVISDEVRRETAF